MNIIFLAVMGSLILGYFLGCINISYLFSKIKGFDIRTVGSGNAGASNIVIVFGKKAGLFVALFDIFKAWLAVIIAQKLFPSAIVSDINYAGIVAGVGTIIGHIAPFYMGFKGGKGLASLGGTILALDARLFLIMLFIAIVIAVVTDYICFVPMSISIIYPVTYGYLHHTYWPVVIFIVPTILIWYKHQVNIARIKEGTELKFHFLWNRKSESERFGIEDDGKSVFEVELDENLSVKKREQ